MSAQPEFWARELPSLPEKALAASVERVRQAVAEYNPTHTVMMVSGGDDSAAAEETGQLLGLKVDLILHGRTGTGIPEATQHAIDYYGNRGPDFAIADAGDAYERYVMRKGFFGVGKEAHHFAYHILKADPFRAAISRHIRKGRRGVRVMLLNGARKTESENRKINLKPMRLDKGNLWVNIIHDWTQGDRDQLIAANNVCRSPVAVQLCKSGECWCGTQQSMPARMEATAIYPKWGAWINGLDRAVKLKHGFGWADPYPKPRDPLQGDLFEPLCADCDHDALAAQPPERVTEDA